MRRALRGAVGVLLAVGAVVPARWVPAQAPPPWLHGQQTPVRKILYEENSVLSEGPNRLEEMKVELALLSDIATFPYYLSARAAGETLRLRGLVPNDSVRQRAEELARRNTSLTVRNELNLSTRPPLRPVMVMQKEGAELLLKNFNDVAGPMHIDARPNGLIVLVGTIDSVESKLEISRLFRQLPGCSGVVNELVVQQVLHNGKRVVRVTKDGSMVVAPTALGQEPQQAMASPPATIRPTPLPPTPTAPVAVAPPPLPEPIPPIPSPHQLPPSPPRTEPATLPPTRRTLPLPAPLPTRALDALDGELRLPSALPPSTPAAAPERGAAGDALTPPKLPLKWGHPTTSWEAQLKSLEKLRTTPPSAETKKPNAALPSPIPFAEAVTPPQKTTKTVAPPAPSKSSRAKKDARTDFAATHGISTPTMTWKRPGTSEESEPKEPAAAKKAESPRAAPPPPPPLPSTPLRRWPPAYETRPPNSPKGTPGVITFDDDPAPAPAAKPAALGTSRPIVPADLQRRVKSACGWQAREVIVQIQNDGGVLVKVKVPNLHVEDQLTKKILAIPEMTAPRVRLIMDVGP